VKFFHEGVPVIPVFFRGGSGNGLRSSQPNTESGESFPMRKFLVIPVFFRGRSGDGLEKG
jgi:hypothetical protein